MKTKTAASKSARKTKVALKKKPPKKAVAEKNVTKKKPAQKKSGQIKTVKKQSARQIDWSTALEPVIKKYDKKKHPLDYKSPYQLMVMVVLSAQDSDRHINQVAPLFFEQYPDFQSIAKVKREDLFPFLRSVRNFANKSSWLIEMAGVLASAPIPSTMKELTNLPGIGRKSASVIQRELGQKAEGIIVDLHVVRVAPRLGITNQQSPPGIEKDLMAVLPEKQWGKVGMAISFLGRETCRPTNPACTECPMEKICNFAAAR